MSDYVTCPNNCCTYLEREETFTIFGRCYDVEMIEVAVTMKRKDLEENPSQSCYLRPYECEFCGLKDTYEAITGNRCPIIASDSDSDLIDLYMRGDHYKGHQAECPEASLRCPNNCKSGIIKRKDMKRHRSECPEEPVECPFAEAGCKKKTKAVPTRQPHVHWSTATFASAHDGL